jgi:peptidoglycan hydrolase CwlO-like protein
LNKILGVFLSVFYFTQVYAIPENAPLKKVQERLGEERKLIVNDEIKKRGILGALYDINKDLGKILGDIESIEAQMATYQKSIESYARVIVNLERIRDRQKTLLKQRLRALYKLGFKGYAELLLSSQTSSDFSRNMKFLKIIAFKDSQMIENFKKSLELLGKQQAKLKRQVKSYLEFEANLKVQQQFFAEEKKKQTMILT